MKKVSLRLPWSDKDEWYVPDFEECRSFKELPGDIDNALKLIVKHAKNRRICIQAGGHLGFWPIALSTIFEQVITFEPAPVNLECLRENIKGITNIHLIDKALSLKHNIRMELGEHHNSGTYHVKSDGDILTASIDDLAYDNVDLIYLDIEGSERDALKGARKTIETSSPLIGLEYKLDIEIIKWIQYIFKYRIVGYPSRRDVLFK